MSGLTGAPEVISLPVAADERDVEPDRKAIVITGIPGAGTSWTGKMFEAGGGVVYVNEPLNPLHPPGRSPGVLNVPVAGGYTYVTRDNEAAYLDGFRELLNLRFHVLADLDRNHGPYDVLRTINNWQAFGRGRRRGRRVMIDDPFCAFTLPWLVERLRCRAVLLVRHPAAIASRWQRYGTPGHAADMLGQPLLVRDWLEPYAPGLRSVADDRRSDPIERAGAVWRAIYGSIGRWALDHPAVTVARHEDLSEDPVGRFAELYGWLGLPMTSSAEAAITAATTGSSPERSHSWSFTRHGLSKTAFRPMDSRANIGAWKRRLSKDEVVRIRRATEPEAASFYGDADWR
jgi:hypothetical protein